MDQIVDGDVQQDTYTEWGVDAAKRDLTVNHQLAAAARSEAGKQLPPEVASHQVVVGDIPVEPPGFVPRAGLLAELDRAGTRISVIHPATGLKGLGATQAAAAYARAKLAAGWRLVAWVNGANTGSLLAGLAAVAEATGLTDGDSGRRIADVRVAVRHGLETDGDRCLLVFDDVADHEALRPFVPVHGTARVLIITARQQAADLGSSVPVEVFDAEEASAFLARRTGLDDDAGATAVAGVLGHLPLALALAAPLIAGPHRGYGWYLRRLQAMPADVSLTEEDGQPYPQGVARTVLLSLQAVRAADRTGVCTRVMEIMTVLPSAGVRRELLYAAGQAGVLASGGRWIAADLVDQVLEWLADRSLLAFSLDGQTVTLHRPVARVIHDGLVRTRRLTAVCEAAAFVLELHSRALAGSQDRRAVRGFLQQATALLDSLTQLAAVVDEELAWVLLRLRFSAFYHAVELGDSASQAIAVGEPLAEDLERLLGPDHPDTLNSRNSLAAAYLAAGRLADAIPLFEQTLAVQQRTLGPDHPETLTSQNNLASAYQDAGRAAEAISLYEQNLEVRERLLGPDHPSTMNSRSNLAAAYQKGDRPADAIPLFEQTLADRERVLGPDHPDTRTSRRKLACAYQDAGRAADAIPLLEQTSVRRTPILRADFRDTRTSSEDIANTYLTADRVADEIPSAEQTRAAPKSRLSDDVAGQVPPAGVRRPPADPARRILPANVRRPPADPAKRPLPDSVAGPPAELRDHSISRAQDPLNDAQYDREVVAAITTGDPAGIAMAYDRYAASLYDYCHWMLHDSADAANALQDTFVIAVITLSDLSEPSELRPRLFVLARYGCRRRIRTKSSASSASHEGADAAHEPADAVAPPMGPIREPSDATVQFRAVGRAADAIREPSDATMLFHAVGQPANATMPFPVVSLSANGTGGQAHVSSDQGQAELRSLAHSILAGLKPREREVIELSFRHGLYDNDLAIALGGSSSRAHALASRARGRLEDTLNALHIALTRREACPALGELLADWDGQLTEHTSDLVVSHIEECETCARHGWGALSPAAFFRLLPLAPMPPELREQVLSRCTSTDAEAVAYRRRAARHAQSILFTRITPTISRVRWSSIRSNPGVAIAAAAVVVWVVAALSATLLTFLGSHAARAQVAPPASSHAAGARAAPVTGSLAGHAQSTQTRVGTSVTSPVAAPTTATAPAAAAARSHPTASQPSAFASSPVQPSPSQPASPWSSQPASQSQSPLPSQPASASGSSSTLPSSSASPTP